MAAYHPSLLLLLFAVLCSKTSGCTPAENLTRWERGIAEYVNRTLSVDHYRLSEGVSIEPTQSGDVGETTGKCVEGRAAGSLTEFIQRKYEDYARTHVLTIKVPDTARFFLPQKGSPFMTGFTLGFIAFGLKKLLLPIIIVSQIVQSVLVAMFLPSILGSLGKLVGKGLSKASSVSGFSGGSQQQQQIEDFEFKDTDGYGADSSHDYSTVSDPYGMDVGASNIGAPVGDAAQQANSRFGHDNYNRVSYQPTHSDNYYIRKPNKQFDYKVFHKIPSSSMLLTTYDPFYSPLLSRLDSVFQQLGLGSGKGPQVEKCREKLICLMYANPAKYAPYSNLVSAQLSRELNELRKPSTDNPEILRFFRYMKAAKDGQDSESCSAYVGCSSLQATKPSPAMLTTYNDINKLVLARNLH